MSERAPLPIRPLDAWRWEIPQDARPGMRVPGLVFASADLMEFLRHDQALEQVANVATLPGIVKASLAMPDIHWGYGFAIGGVAATDPDEGGVICPGGIGFDINCGIRLMQTHLTADEVRPQLKDLVAQLFRDVPCGVGVGGDVRCAGDTAHQVVRRGAAWAVEQGYGVPDDLECTEAGGALEGADPEAISERAYTRGRDQLGTLGSGNHFLEVQRVEQVFDPAMAEALGLAQGQVTVMIHSGSRGFGYQVCDDFLETAGRAMAAYGITVPDRQLACVPVRSPEGQRYLGAMRGAANYAWANRQLLMHRARGAFEHLFRKGWQALGMTLVYDVAHNIAKLERYVVEGRERVLCVHRKGATRAFPPGHPELPARYRAVGQPVIIPGDMGRASYVLVGAPGAMTETFGSTCHGAGRVMSRTAAIRAAKGRSIRQELEAHGVVAIARGRTGLDEEQPAAYKDIDAVVEVVAGAGLSRKVCRLRPMGVIKG